MILGNPITLGGGGSGGKTQFSLLVTSIHTSNSKIDLSPANPNNKIIDVGDSFTLSISDDTIICNKSGTYLFKTFLFLPSNLQGNSNSLSVVDQNGDVSLVYHYALKSSSENKLSELETEVDLTAGQILYFTSVLGGTNSLRALGLYQILEV